MVRFFDEAAVAGAAPGLAIPAENAKLGWCADFDLLTEIVTDVRNKSGSELCCEWVDDVIISPQSHSYVKVSPNAPD